LSSRKRKEIRPEQLSPGIARGLTQGVPPDKVEAELGIERRPGPGSGHMGETEFVPGTRIPLPKFLVEDDPHSFTVVSGRPQRGARVILLPETLAAMKAGWICLRCMEPQDEPFPFRCTSPPEMGCEYRISDCQLRDIAIEYEGETEVGPTPVEEPT
jgi:hypothetical protein